MSPQPQAFVLLSGQPTARTATSLGHLWRVLVDAIRRPRADHDATGYNLGDRQGLADLDDRMLRDIGASEWRAANAAMRAYDDLRTRIDGGLG
jgi:hypothetical protein